MAILVTTADAIVTVLNDASLGLSFTPTRAYRPIRDLREVTDLTVTIVPKGQEIAMADRVQGQRDIQIDIGIQQKMTTASNDEVDVLMDFVDEIIDLIRNTRVFGTAQWLKTENELIYAPEHLSELRVFTSVLTLSLRAFVA